MISRDFLVSLSRRARPAYLDAFEGAAATLETHGITTPLREAHLLAQVFHETGGLTVEFENMNYTAPRILVIFGVGHHSAAVRPAEAERLAGHPPELAERVYGLGNPHKVHELGNTQAGDGYRYRGGGLLQTTGRGSYRRIGKKIKVDLEARPERLLEGEVALLPAVTEWTEGHLNDAADRDDIRRITRVINGGYNGLPERRAWFDRIYPLLKGDGAAAGWRDAAPGDDVKNLQADLNTLGTDPRLDQDGHYGPDTEAAVKAFQRKQNLKVDGIAGPATLAVIALRLAAR